ncbi:MAG TPA: ShlB/FhaC/HecB family hemolysin secretion/activation protein [Methylophilaceae bacterium]|nr:ShlB/FhaC/HecB family hemolysin secretion/activation protein [Methylophilaceae bacterium]
MSKNVNHHAQLSLPRKNHLAKSFALVITLAQMPVLSFAAPPDAGIIVPNLERQGIPSIKREETAPAQSKPEEKAEPAMADLRLESPIARIEQPSSLASPEITALLSKFVGMAQIPGHELDQARGQVWNWYRQHGRMTRVELQAVSQSESAGGSLLRVHIYEIKIRTIKVEQEGSTDIRQDLLDNILASAQSDIEASSALDLDNLDSRIKRRLFLKDVNVRATLVPIGQDEVDVKILVRAKPLEPLGFLAQYDNYGIRAFGRNRYTAGISIPGRMLAGDQLDVLGIRTSGMTYGRLAYEFPLVGLGARMNVWAAGVDYEASSGIHGHFLQAGTGLIYPLHISNSSVWLGYLNYSNRQEVTRLDDDTRVADKSSNSLQGKVDASYYLSPTQSLYFNAGLTLGKLDLSDLPSAKQQDRISARTDGGYTKLEWGAGWNSLLGKAKKLDFRLGVKGQFADKNLDQSEKLALGGPTGVRAYGPVEALGDDGYVATAEIGYRPTEWLRAYSFYDIGHIRRFHDAWATDSIPQSYYLKGAGAGISCTYKSLVGSLVYAHQIDDNPGLFAGGVDSEGERSRDRLWLSLTLLM